VTTPEWFYNYLIMFGGGIVLLIMAYFKFKNDEDVKILEMKKDVKKQKKLEEEDFNMLQKFINKYKDKHFTKGDDDDYSVWKFLSKDGKDEFLESLDKYKNLQYKSRKYKDIKNEKRIR